MIFREDMLELTRRMTPSRNCFDRIAGAYVDAEGEVGGTFNVHFLNLSGAEKTRNLEIAKTVPFSRTNDQLREYRFRSSAKGKDTIFQLLQVIRKCGLKNDAVMDILYSQLSDGYPVDHDFAIFVFHGLYDVPRKGQDHESQWESEETYDFLITTISPLNEKGDPDKPVWGFLYPAFSNRSADEDAIDVFHADPEAVEEGLMYQLFGREGAEQYGDQ